MKNEKGQALPLAILALAIGALVVTPFLSHAGTSLNSSRLYAEEIGHHSAGDAGIEHAIWNLTRGTLAEQIPDTGDQITYELDETLNGVTTTVTVTTDAAASGGGEMGNINHTLLDSYSFDINHCNTPAILHISGNIYAIAYQGASANGFLKTVEIAPDGAIGITRGTLVFDAVHCSEPNIVRVSGSIYAIAYRGPDDDGFIKTLSIDSAGNIGSTLDSLEFNTADCYEPDIIQVSRTTFAVVYRGPQNKGYLTTLDIASNGKKIKTIETWNFDTAACYQPDIIHISGQIFAIAYGGDSSGSLITVSIPKNGKKTALINTLQFAASGCRNPDIINISGITYGIAYQDSAASGYVTTVSITTDGIISGSIISSFRFNIGNGREPKIISIIQNIYAIVFNGPQNNGFVITLPIEPGGNIPGTIVDTFEYDTASGYNPDILLISEGVLAVAYCVPSTRGLLVTIGIDTTGEGDGGAAASYEIMSVAGDARIRVLVNIQDAASSIVSWIVE